MVIGNGVVGVVYIEDKGVVCGGKGQDQKDRNRKQEWPVRFLNDGFQKLRLKEFILYTASKINGAFQTKATKGHHYLIC